MSHEANMRQLEAACNLATDQTDHRENEATRTDAAKKRKRESERLHLSPTELNVIISLYEADRDVLSAKISTPEFNQKKIGILQRMVEELHKLAGDGTNISQRNIGIKQLWVELKYIKMNALKCWNAHKDFAAAGGEPTLEPGQPDWSFVKRVVQVMGCEDNSGLEDTFDDFFCEKIEQDGVSPKKMKLSRSVEGYLKSLNLIYGELKKLGVDAGGVVFEDDAILCTGSNRLKHLITHPHFTDLFSDDQYDPNRSRQYNHKTSGNWTIRPLNLMDQDPSKMDSDQSGMLHTPTAPSPFSQTAADTLSFSTFSDVSSFRPSTLSWKKNSDFRGYRPEDIQMADGYSAYPTNIDIGSAIDSGLYELSSSTGQLYRLPQPEIPAPPPPMNNSSHLFGTGSGRTFFCQMCQAAFPSLSGLIQHTPVCQGDRLSSGFGDMEGARDGALTGVMEEVTKRERPGSDDPGFLGELTETNDGFSLLADKDRPPEERPYVCDFCSDSFYSSNFLRKHKRKRHGIITPIVPPPDSIQPKAQDTVDEFAAFPQTDTAMADKETTEEKRPFVCDLCGDSYYSATFLQKHLRRKHGIVVPVDSIQPKFPIKTIDIPPDPEITTVYSDNRVISDMINDTDVKSSLLLSPIHNIDSFGNQGDINTMTNGRNDSVFVPDSIDDFGNDSDGSDVMAYSHAVSSAISKAMRSIDGYRSGRDSMDMVSGAENTDNAATTQKVEEQTYEPPELSTTDLQELQESNFACKICGKRFFNEKDYNRHRVTHRTGERPYQCDVCGQRFKQLSTLSVHKGKHRAEWPYVCDVCGDAFYANSLLLRHKRKKHGMTIPSKRKPRKRKAVPEEQNHMCEYCNRVFSSEHRLNNHRKCHTKPFRCDLCHQGFSRIERLKRHKMWHNGIKPYQCDMCSMRFLEKGNLKLHMRTHTGEKPYQCEFCDKAFGQSYALNTHRKLHTGEKPYLCDVCGAAFRQVGMLNRHRRDHSDEKPYRCTVCTDAFRSKRELDIHHRKHTGIQPHTCETCGRYFTTANHLAVHRRLHTGEKPYTCEICWEKFARSDVLGQHRKKHGVFTRPQC